MSRKGRTMREIENEHQLRLHTVQLMYVDGFPIREIAETLYTSISVINTYLWIMRKTGWDLGPRRHAK